MLRLSLQSEVNLMDVHCSNVNLHLRFLLWIYRRIPPPLFPRNELYTLPSRQGTPANLHLTVRRPHPLIMGANPDPRILDRQQGPQAKTWINLSFWIHAT